ncbi:MAG: hypothetical protein ACM3Q2_14730 [Syntrophothermus sp.]
MRILPFVFALILTSILSAQSGYSFLSRLPNLPSDACSMGKERKENFNKELNKFLKEIDEEIETMRRKVRKDAENLRPEIEKKMAEEYGLSGAEVQKLKNKKISKEEKKAIADRMMQEKTGISMDEIEKLKKMSKEGKKAWAQGYSTQQMANLSGNPDSNKTPEQMAMEKDLKRNKKLVELAKEQQEIMNRIQASDRKWANQWAELEKKDSVQKPILDSQTKPLFDRLNALPGPSESEAAGITRTIRMFEAAYCVKMTPDIISMLQEALSRLQIFMPDYDRLEEITAELNKEAMKIDKPISMSSRGLMQLEAVAAYAHNIHLAMRFAHYSFSDAEAEQ